MRNNTTLACILTCIAMIAANYTWQWCTSGNYSIALERSYFQVWALWTFELINKVAIRR